MRATHVRPGSANFDDGTHWCLPDERLGEIEHTLRYGPDQAKVLLSAAEIVHCYWALIHAPQRRRNEIIAAIREAMRMQEATEGEKR